MQSLKSILLGVCVTALAGCAIEEQPEPPPPRDAPFVFLGTVAKEHSSGAGAPARAVRVDRVYFQGGTFDDQTGALVIVSGEDVPSRGQHLFHVEPTQFGALVRANLVAAEPPREYTEDDVDRLKRAKRRQRLLSRVKGAELIFTGAVASTREWSGGGRAESEHDPLFTRATATVTESVLGQPDGIRQEFVFAASDDVQWYRSPKPRPGVDAMFLLRRGIEGGDPALAKVWTLLHEDDLLTGHDMQIVREIVSEGGAR